MDIPGPQKHIHVGLGERLWLPFIDLYTAPTRSVCNGTKELLSYTGFAYRDHNVDDDATIVVMRRLRGTDRGIPVILINGVSLRRIRPISIKAHPEPLLNE